MSSRLVVVVGRRRVVRVGLAAGLSLDLSLNLADVLKSRRRGEVQEFVTAAGEG